MYCQYYCMIYLFVSILIFNILTLVTFSDKIFLPDSLELNLINMLQLCRICCRNSNLWRSSPLREHFSRGTRLLIRNKSTSSGNVNTGQRSADFRRILALALPERYRLGAAMGLLVISSGITMAVPYAIGKIIDIIYNLDQLKDSDQESQKQIVRDRLQTVCVGLSGVFLLGGLCNFGRVYLMRVSGQNITAALRRKLFGSIIKQDTAFFDKNKTGELINRLSADTQLVSLTVTQQVRGQQLHLQLL